MQNISLRKYMVSKKAKNYVNYAKWFDQSTFMLYNNSAV